MIVFNRKEMLNRFTGVYRASRGGCGKLVFCTNQMLITKCIVNLFVFRETEGALQCLRSRTHMAKWGERGGNENSSTAM